MASQQFFSLVDCVMVVSLLLPFLYLHVGPSFSVSGVQLFSPLLLVLKEGLFLTSFLNVACAVFTRAYLGGSKK